MRAWVSGIILAAGGSSRLGQPKQLLAFRGTTLLGWVVDRVASARDLDELIVVLGGAAAEIRSRVDLGRLKVVENPEFGQGCAASYRSGLAALDPGAEAVVVVPGDQVGIETEDLDRVVETWRQSRHPIVVGSYLGRPAHPLLFARALFGELLALKGDKAAWKLLDAHPDWVRPVELGRPRPRDVDTWEDYQSVLTGPSTASSRATEE